MHEPRIGFETGPACSVQGVRFSIRSPAIPEVHPIPGDESPISRTDIGSSPAAGRQSFGWKPRDVPARGRGSRLKGKGEGPVFEKEQEGLSGEDRFEKHKIKVT